MHLEDVSEKKDLRDGVGVGVGVAVGLRVVVDDGVDGAAPILCYSCCVSCSVLRVVRPGDRKVEEVALFSEYLVLRVIVQVTVSKLHY